MTRSPLAVAVGAAVLLVVVSAGTAAAYPPSPPGEATARDHLAALTIANENSMDGYDRDKFPHWAGQSGACNTREVVLRRDGTDITTGQDCYPTSGRWYSVYDQQWVAEPGDVHIDHVVPLAESWRSGADEWPTSRREAFANDLDSQQLIAVSGESNREKSNDDPAEWMVPDNSGDRCLYARSWIHVKYTWNLTVDPAEQAALAELLDTC